MKVSQELFDKLQKLAHAEIDENGCELLNPIPRDISAGVKPPLTLNQRVARAMAQMISRQADIEKYETIADANNFELDDPVAQRLSGYEWEEMPNDPEPPEPAPDPSPDPEPDPAPDPEPTP